MSLGRRGLLCAGAAFAVYFAGSVLLLGRSALTDPEHVCACIGSGDPPAYMWDLQWWPYALIHGLNPLFSHAIWSPAGANLASGATIPLPSLLFWPVTAALGPLPAYNLLTLLSPAAAALGMFLLCLHLTGHRGAALAGGWLYGFSSYELSQVVGHANLMLIALPPLAVLLVLRRLDGRLGRGGFIALLGGLLIAQLLTSSEILVTGGGFGALSLGLGWLLAGPAARRGLVTVTLEVLASGVGAAILTSPFIYSALSGQPPPLPGAGTMGTDLASLVVPLQVTLIQFAPATAAKLPFVAEQGSYFGLALLLAFGATLWQRRRTRSTMLLGAVAASALLLSFGSSLTVAGHRLFALPWRVAEHVPVVKGALPDRLILYAWFALAVGVAQWLATPGRLRWARWGLVLVGIVFILPDGASGLFTGAPHNPQLFTSRAYRRVLAPRTNVLILPFGFAGYSMLWQAEADFAFRMPEGYVGYAPPAAFSADPVAAALINSQVAGSASVPAPTLRTYLSRYRVRTVLVDALDPGGWPARLATLGLSGRLVGGVIVYQLPAAR